MKTTAKILMLIPLLAMGLTACGGGKSTSVATSSEAPKSSETPTSSENPSSTSEAESEAESESEATSQSTSKTEVKNVTVKFWHTFGQTIVEGLNAKIEQFEKAVKENEGIDVDVQLIYQGGYDDIAKKIRDGYSVNNKPTIAVAYPDHIADYLQIAQNDGEEFVVNLDKFIDDKTVGFGTEAYLGDKEGKDDFVEEFFSEGSAHIVDGTYSLPYMKSTEIMFYNLDLLIEAFKYFKPEFESSESKITTYMRDISWNDFLDLAECINNHKTDISNMLEVPFWYDSDANFFITKMYQNNIPFSSINNNGKGQIDFSSGEAFNDTVSMLTDLQTAYNKGLFTTKGIKNTYGSDFFTGEKCVFSIGSSGGSGYNFPKADDFRLGVCRVPASNDNPIYVSQGPTLALFSDNGLSDEVNEATQLYAWKFMKYITNGQTNAELCIAGSEGYVPVRYSAYETKYFQQFMAQGEKYAQCYKVVVDDINAEGGYLVTPCFKGSADLRDECGTLLTAALRGDDTIEKLVKKAIDNALLHM